MQTNTLASGNNERLNRMIETVMETMGTVSLAWFYLFILVDLIDKMGWLKR